MTPTKRDEIIEILKGTDRNILGVIFTKTTILGTILYFVLNFISTFYLIIPVLLLLPIWFSPLIMDYLKDGEIILKLYSPFFLLLLSFGVLFSNELIFILFGEKIYKFLDRRFFISKLMELTEECYNLGLDSNGDLEIAEILLILEDVQDQIDELFKISKYKIFLVEESRIYLKKACSELLLSFINILENLHKQLLTEVTEQIQDLETSKKQLSDLRSDTINLDSVKQLQLKRIEQKLEEFKEFSHKLEIQL